MTTRKIGLHLVYGGNPPDAGSLYHNGVRVAWLPRSRITTLTLAQALALFDVWCERDRVRPLSRRDVEAALDPSATSTDTD